VAHALPCDRGAGNTSGYIIFGSVFTHQMTYAATGQNTWHEAYFGWLYSNPLTGLWGLSHLSHDRPVFIQTIMVLMGLILSLLLIFAVISEFLLMGRRKQILPATLIGISFVLAAVIQFLYLFLQKPVMGRGKRAFIWIPFHCDCHGSLWAEYLQRLDLPLECNVAAHYQKRNSGLACYPMRAWNFPDRVRIRRA